MALPFPLRSERLLVRPFVEEDLAAMRAVFGDPEVMRYVGDGVPMSPRQIADALRAYRAHQESHGFACWAVVDPGLGTPIGDAGFVVTGQGVEFGYTLHRDWWGRGLATEVGRLCVETAFGPLGLRHLIALADAANPASARVLVKLGFQLRRECMAYGRTHLQFELAHPAPPRPRPD